MYPPPTTLAEMRESDRSAYRMEGSSTDGLFFRANNTFPADAEHYYANGSLPERACGHERQYLD